MAFDVRRERHSKGACNIRRRASRRVLVCGRTQCSTMMQQCASQRSSRSGPILPRGLTDQVVARVTATSEYQGSAITSPSPNRCLPSYVYTPGRNLIPAGISPVIVRRQNAMSNLRASATIRVLRVPPRASAVRARNHWANALSFWKRRKRQASWIIPRRPRALPARASPFSRLRRPLSSGAPVRPA